MKEKVILGTVTLMVSLNSPIAALANIVTDQARIDAENAVLNHQVIDAHTLRQRGDEYTREFLIQFHQAAQRYQAAYRQGTTAEQSAGKAQDLFGQKAYEEGQQSKDDPEKKVQDDSEEYPRMTPTIDQARFIHKLVKLAQKVGKDYDLYPSIIIAQAVLESDWGRSELGASPHHNLFGVKGSYQGKSVLKPTTEFHNGKEHEIKDYFRSYPSDKEALTDYGETLSDPLYVHVHRSQTSNYRQATKALVGIYATDPDYNKKLNQIIDHYNLTKYDGVRKEGGEARLPAVKEHVAHLRSTAPKHKKVNKKAYHKSTPILSVIGGAASVGLTSGAKRLLAS